MDERLSKPQPAAAAKARARKRAVPLELTGREAAKARSGDPSELPKLLDEHHADIINLSYEPIFVWTEAEGIVEWNKGSESLYGYTREEALGQDVHKLLRTVHTLPTADQLARLTESGRWTAEQRQTARDGREVIVECRQQVFEADGRRFVVETNRDITERKRAEAERQELLERERVARLEAEAANKAKDEFLAVVSHELRTPLHSIKGWVSILHSGVGDDAMREHGYEVIIRNVNSQNALIEDILDVSRIVLGKLKLDLAPIDLASIVRNVVDEERPAVEAAGLTLDLDAAADIGEISGDRIRIRQIVSNLLSNAVKFTPDNGRIAVRLVLVDDKARLSVEDNGAGIPADIIDRIFDRFLQADSTSRRRHNGLGIGLAIVKHLVELHGGTIRAESAGEGKGSTFTVDLPLSNEA